jgi:hypothetical protein
MNAFQDMAKKYELKDELVAPGLLILVVQNTPGKKRAIAAPASAK